jgi:hypothetical protein
VLFLPEHSLIGTERMPVSRFSLSSPPLCACQIPSHMAFFFLIRVRNSVTRFLFARDLNVHSLETPRGPRGRGRGGINNTKVSGGTILSPTPQQLEHLYHRLKANRPYVQGNE